MRASQDARWKRAKAESALRLRCARAVQVLSAAQPWLRSLAAQGVPACHVCAWTGVLLPWRRACTADCTQALQSLSQPCQSPGMRPGCARPGQSGRAQSDSRRARRKYKQYDESVQSERAANAAAELERRRALRREQDELMRKPWQAPKIADGAGVRPKTPRVRARAQRPNSAQAQRLEGRWRERVEASEGLAKFIRKQRAAVKDGEQQVTVVGSGVRNSG